MRGTRHDNVSTDVEFLGKDTGNMSNKGASAHGLRTLCYWIKNMKWEELRVEADT